MPGIHNNRASTSLALNLDGVGASDLILRAGVAQNFGALGSVNGGIVRLENNNPAALLATSSTAGPALALSNTLSNNLSNVGGGSNYWGNFRNDIFRESNGVNQVNIAFGSTGYIGIRFQGDTGSGSTQFAWLKVRADYDTSGANHKVSLNVLEWAYDNSGANLHVADTGASGSVPTPATPLLALLGMGAMGIQGYRRRRDQGLKWLADEQSAA
jgi:hypothetical protein